MDAAGKGQRVVVNRTEDGDYDFDLDFTGFGSTPERSVTAKFDPRTGEALAEPISGAIPEGVYASKEAQKEQSRTRKKFLVEQFEEAHKAKLREKPPKEAETYSEYIDLIKIQSDDNEVLLKKGQMYDLDLGAIVEADFYRNGKKVTLGKAFDVFGDLAYGVTPQKSDRIVRRFKLEADDEKVQAIFNKH